LPERIGGHVIADIAAHVQARQVYSDASLFAGLRRMTGTGT
jgi:hypothetical protein